MWSRNFISHIYYKLCGLNKLGIFWIHFWAGDANASFVPPLWPWPNKNNNLKSCFFSKFGRDKYCCPFCESVEHDGTFFSLFLTSADNAIRHPDDSRLRPLLNSRRTCLRAVCKLLKMLTSRGPRTAISNLYSVLVYAIRASWMHSVYALTAAAVLCLSARPAGGRSLLVFCRFNLNIRAGQVSIYYLVHNLGFK